MHAFWRASTKCTWWHLNMSFAFLVQRLFATNHFLPRTNALTLRDVWSQTVRVTSKRPHTRFNTCRRALDCVFGFLLLPKASEQIPGYSFKMVQCDPWWPLVTTILTSQQKKLQKHFQMIFEDTSKVLFCFGLRQLEAEIMGPREPLSLADGGKSRPSSARVKLRS